ncbi:hypothetical protein [Algoriphagus sp. A40]|uniref:hypothetical protein n=1 Tax=Algoriphagus sp. A40 TaxID=1945863 RepID=UPI000987D660|nr:hypothetical protein [Algoriphagus sp. A40]OOG72372.1 hypothetical protein B0E43_15885 [Algoriphagus sp. A40]
MQKRLPLLLMVLSFLFTACEEKTESPELDLQQEFQPLGIGLFWIYEVDETIYFGENDAETFHYFYKDLVRSSYLNAENEVTYIVERTKSSDRTDWSFELEYTLIYRDRLLLRTTNNLPLAALVFPPQVGRIWNGKSYQSEGDDDFEIEFSGQSQTPGFEDISAVRVSQENLDDKITIRDIRYEVFGEEVGLLEKYDEVLTYCSRNDCLGDLLINGGSKTHLKLVDYGRN